MPRLFLAVVLAVLAGPLNPASAQNLNPEYGSAVYQPFSIFAPGVRAGAELGPRVVVVFHGFRSAVPNGTFKRIFRALDPDITVVGVNYDYFDVVGTARALDRFAKDKLAGRRVAVLGTSLGGFWADWFGRHIGAQQIVMINPVPKPWIRLQKYVGQTVESTRRATAFTVSALEVAVYRAVPDPGTPSGRTLLIVTDGEPHANAIEAHFAGRRGLTVSHYEGKHSINLKKHPARAEILAVLRSALSEDR